MASIPCQLLATAAILVLGSHACARSDHCSSEDNLEGQTFSLLQKDLVVRRLQVSVEAGRMINPRFADRPQMPPWGSAMQVPTGVTHVMINVGPNFQPIAADDAGALVILVDPLPSVVNYLRQHAGPNVQVYQAAISNFSGTADFHELGTDSEAQSSSLANPNIKGLELGGRTVQVQVHTLQELLDSIPSSLPVTYLKTDMQGFDLTAIKSAGNELKRVKEILAEVYQDGKPTYQGTVNEHHEWIQYMQQMGFQETSCEDSYVTEPKVHEMNCGFKVYEMNEPKVHEMNEPKVHLVGGGSPSEWKEIKVFAGPEVILGRKGQLHSQVAQDWIVASLLGCRSGGFFVDLAANDAMGLSNTLMLERDFAWNGLCIEANMDYMYGLSHRKCQVVSGAVGAQRDQKVQFTMGGVWGGIVGKDFDNHKNGEHTETLATVPLGDILDDMKAPTQIEYLSLDVEGAESVVMKDFAFDKYRFSVITVERPKPDLQKALSDNGYQRLRFNSEFGDETWIDAKLPNFAELMADWGNKKPGFSKACMIENGYPVPQNFENEPELSK
jgi:FkbM family methyltransferase